MPNASLDTHITRIETNEALLNSLGAGFWVGAIEVEREGKESFMGMMG